MAISLQTASHTVNYTYDADGLRVTKTVDGTKHTYQYVGGLLMYETRGDLTFIYDYDAYGHLSCINYIWKDGTTSWKFYVACNSRGDVTAIYAADGTLRAKYTYDSWGNTLSIIDRYGNDIIGLEDNTIAADNIGVLNKIRYRGYYYDSESGLYYLQSRYYDPQVKRFVNADSYVSTGQGLTSSNMFAYCGNNPVNRADGTGQFWLLVAVVAISLAVTLGGCSQPTTQPSVSPSSSSKPSATSSTTFSTSLPSISPTLSPQGPSQQEKSYAATVYAEAGGQNRRSKQAVAHVMNNRVGTRSSWTDIEAVISAKYQFDGYGSPMYNAAMEYYNTGICENSIDKAAMDECLAVVIPIYDGIEADITGGALYFHSFANPSDWKYHDSYTQVYVEGTECFWFYK